MASELGFTMAAPRPRSMAMVKNALLIISRWGRPKEIFDTPRMDFTPRSRIRSRVSRVVSAPRLSELTVMHRPSRIISSGPMPYRAASRRIFSPTAARPWAVSGIPSSSRQRPTITPPYLAASGKICSITSALPFTEFMRALPL